MSGTPFANCRHQEKWPVYAAYRLAGYVNYHAAQLSGLSTSTSQYRESVIRQLLSERWPALLP
ncbi:hypothetical protein [Serratia oryzae]|uniref:Uncharacterized protein n=1 Tax=Serratia oryzae TaxID=2034155 RepID=A0A1S8CS83_9GAMM|nr:hypothetical protein [Serratia oryzae]OMQ27328.1 hypothetical protein BMI79_03110 [Serratia oryzae]